MKAPKNLLNNFSGVVESVGYQWKNVEKIIKTPCLCLPYSYIGKCPIKIVLPNVAQSLLRQRRSKASPENPKPTQNAV